jgi:phosphohistidine phosphatase
MKLYLVRHARAEPPRARLDDAARALTRAGRERLLEVRAGLVALGFAPERIVHSPWLRALQTAELLADGAIETEVHAGLASPPDAGLVAGLARLAASAGANGSLCCVGHEPWLSDLAALLCRDEGAHESGLELKKAGVIELDGELRPAGMRIVALLPPRVLRRVARADGAADRGAKD